MTFYWDEELGDYVCDLGVAPSAEEEYFASLEPQREGYELDVILAQSRLTQKQLFVIECHYGFRGPAMTEREIAALMGVTQQAVHRLIGRALVNLRKGLSKSPYGCKGVII